MPSLLWLIILVLLVAALAGVGPWWGHSRDWGYGPTGVVGLLIIVLLVLWLTGRLR